MGYLVKSVPHYVRIVKGVSHLITTLKSALSLFPFLPPSFLVPRVHILLARGELSIVSPYFLSPYFPLFSGRTEQRLPKHADVIIAEIRAARAGNGRFVRTPFDEGRIALVGVGVVPADHRARTGASGRVGVR